MSQAPGTNIESPSLAQERRIDQVCDQFEAAWNAGQRPALQDYLGGLPEAEHGALLRELIAVEIENRRRVGENPKPEDYQPWFAYLAREWLASRIQAEPGACASEVSAAQKTVVDRSDTGSQEVPPGSQVLSCVKCHLPIPWSARPADELFCSACDSTALPAPDPLALSSASPGRQLGKFQFLRPLGVGAFGAVWLARDTELDRRVALKIPHASLLTAPDNRERFHREARAVAQLRHPHIVTIHEVAFLEGRPTLVSDYIEGLTLKQFQEARPLTFREAAAVLVQVADALDYAHTQGVVHRDIKPANIMIELRRQQGPGPRPQGPELLLGDFVLTALGTDLATASVQPDGPRALVLDFGLALRHEGESTLTQEGEILGTPAYMSPEQARGEAHLVDGRSDVCSLGVILYELLTGELPFRGNSRMIAQQVLNDEPLPPRKLNDRVPRDLETICLKAMWKEPGQRYASAKDLAEDLRRFLRGEPVHARPVGFLSRLWLWCHRPERVRDAGMFLLFSDAVFVLWGLCGLTFIATGLHPTEDPRNVLLHLASFMCLTYLPALWIGLGTLDRRLAAVWAGAFFLLVHVGFALGRYGGLHEYDFGGLHPGPAERLPTWTLVSIYACLQLLAYLIALRAYYSNWNVMRWSRDRIASPRGIPAGTRKP